MDTSSRYTVTFPKSASFITPHSHVTDFSALIRLGCLVSKGELGLAVRAVKKARRFTTSEIQLLVALDSETQNHQHLAPEVISLTPITLKRTLIHHRYVGTLFTPQLNEHFGAVFLYTVAAGVPLDVLNYRTLLTEESGPLPQLGEAFLGIR